MSRSGERSVSVVKQGASDLNAMKRGLGRQRGKKIARVDIARRLGEAIW